MCGRFTREHTWREVHHFHDPHFPAGVVDDLLAELGIGPSYNVAPTQNAPVITGELAEGGVLGGRARLLRWGFAPAWAAESGRPGVINAKAETIASRPMFRRDFRDRRCIVPMSSFYEWEKRESGKQPWRIFRADRAPLIAAGIWHPRDAKPGEPPGTFAIITTEPNAFMARLHDRMPAFLEPEDVAAWCDPRTPADTAEAMLRPAPEGVLDAHPVSTRVNSPRVNEPSLVDPVAAADPTAASDPGLFG